MLLANTQNNHTIDVCHPGIVLGTDTGGGGGADRVGGLLLLKMCNIYHAIVQPIPSDLVCSDSLVSFRMSSEWEIYCLAYSVLKFCVWPCGLVWLSCAGSLTNFWPAFYPVGGS